METIYDRKRTGKAAKIANDPTKHYPSKNEAHVLRQIMSKTGLTEDEVRSDIKYRRILAEAQKDNQKAKRSKTEKFFNNLIKKACRQTKLAKEHPITIEALQKIIDNTYNSCYLPWYIWRSSKPSAYQLVGVKRK